MSKKRLRERLNDICNGAGMTWIEEDGYFEGFCMESIARVVLAIRDVFQLKDDNRMHNPNYWEQLEDLDEMTELVMCMIENDGE